MGGVRRVCVRAGRGSACASGRSGCVREGAGSGRGAGGL